MSIYDTIYCELKCRHCGVTAEFEVDVRFSNTNLNQYKIGDCINEIYRLLVEANQAFKIEGYAVYEHCHKDFFTEITVVDKVIKKVVVDCKTLGYLH